MSIKYSDEEISRLILECKKLPKNYKNLISLKRKRGHKERELDVPGTDGNQFRMIFRQSNFNLLDFSIILALVPSDSNLLFRLRRYNGKSHEHTNPIERTSFYDFHIHYATERYQDIGGREDVYAEPTDRFTDFQTALQCFLTDCGFEEPFSPQLPLFPEG